MDRQTGSPDGESVTTPAGSALSAGDAGVMAEDLPRSIGARGRNTDRDVTVIRGAVA